MKCLRCQNAMVEKEYDHVVISSCGKCEGIWLDAGKLQPILNAHDTRGFSPELIRKTLQSAHTGVPKAEVDALLPCPRCSAKMNAMNYNYSSGIIINSCPKGDGLWFDKDELAEVQIFMDHWDTEERKHNKEWARLVEGAKQQVSAELDEEEQQIESHLGPISRIMSSVLYHFENLGKRK